MNYKIQNVTNEQELGLVLAFAEKIFGKDNPGLIITTRQEWIDQLSLRSQLMLYAEANNEVIAIVLGFFEGNGNITVRAVATDKQFRKQGIAEKLIFLLEERSKTLDVHLIALGSVEVAEEFYAKLGYTGQLLIQSVTHGIDELLALNPGYQVAYTNIYDGTINQVCLKLSQADRELQKLYETTFNDCHTQMMFWKLI